MNEINKADLTICALQEVRQLNHGSALVDVRANDTSVKYEVYWSGNKLKRQHGVGIAVKYSPRVEIIEVLPISARIIALDVVFNGCELRAISCYAPTEDSPDSTKDSFYRSLRKQMTGIPAK